MKYYNILYLPTGLYLKGYLKQSDLIIENRLNKESKILDILVDSLKMDIEIEYTEYMQKNNIIIPIIKEHFQIVITDYEI